MGYKVYKKKYRLVDYEYKFIEQFEKSHSFQKALNVLDEDEQILVRDALGSGRTNLSKAYNEFVLTAPIHPEANKVTILDDLIWVKNQSRNDKDTMGVIRAVQEINKMIQGNLVTPKENTAKAVQLIGLYDLSKKTELPAPKEIEETPMIEI